MQPLSLQRLASNAYRTLGLSGSATQAQIDAAARRMKIWPDPARIPPTPWDLPTLGPVARSKSDIEQALSRLRQPITRLEDRLCWYGGERPPTGPVMSDVAEGGSIIHRHDSAIAALHDAVSRETDSSDVTRWDRAMNQLTELTSDPAYFAWLSAADSTGGFDMRASPAELAELAGQMPIALADSLAPRAEAAFARNDLIGCASLLGVIRLAGERSSAAENNLLDRAEDALSARCSEWDDDFRPKLGTNHSNPAPFYAENYAASVTAEASFRRDIAPMMRGIIGLMGGHEAHDPNCLDRQRRVLTQSAHLLELLALGYEWGGQFVKAEQILLEGIELAEGTPALLSIQRALDRVAPKAREQEAAGTIAASTDNDTIEWTSYGGSGLNAGGTTVTSSYRQRPTNAGGNTKGYARLGWILFVLVGGLARLIANNGSHSSSPSIQPYNPNQVPPLDLSTILKETLKDRSTGESMKTEDEQKTEILNSLDRWLAETRPTSRPTTVPTFEQTFGETHREP